MKSGVDRAHYIFGKLLSFLRVRSAAGGLEISDQVLRLALFNGSAWRMAAVRLEPGVLEKGKIKNAESFVESLRVLRAKIMGPKDSKKMHVVVVLSSTPIYSQSFVLPLMDGQDLARAVALNVQMLSPMDASQVYSGAELLERDEENLRITMSAAFVDRTIVDGLAAALLEAGFVAVGAESRPLALMRILRERAVGVDKDKSYLLVNIDNVGIDFLIVRKGQLYFEYANQWADLVDEKGQVSIPRFKETLTSSFRQVMNFYSQHWHEPITAVILSAGAFEEMAEQAIAEAAALPVIRLGLLADQPLSSEWFVVLGASVRGFRSSARDLEINLLGEGATDAFAREELLRFLSFWRVTVPVALGLLIVTFGLANLFLSRTRVTIETQSISQLSGNRIQEIAALQASSTAFNLDVALFQSVMQLQHPKYPIIAEIEGMAASSTVELNQISFQGPGSSLFLSGSAVSEDNIIAFKTMIEGDPHFGKVDLPLTAIHQTGQQFSFTMNVPIASFQF